MVGFTDECRVIGTAAEQNLSFNGENTVIAITRILGLKYSQIPEHELKRFTCKVSRDAKTDDILFHVKYLGEDRVFTAIEIAGMLLGKLREIIEKDAEATGVDAVISVPVYYIDSQYRALYQAAKIAGINVLKLIPTTTAAAMEYGLYKDNLPKKDEKPFHVAFVDVGHTDTSVSIVAITETKVKVLSSAFDRDLGGQDFEEALFNHFADDILKRYKLDIRSNPKASKRLLDASERIKKTLSANSVAKTHVECIMNDTDVSLEIERETFEKLVGQYIERFQVPVKKALEDSKISIADITSVEVLGGSTYVPFIRTILSEIFQKQVMSTTNVSECVSRGCAIQAAMLSPTTRLAKDFQVEDVVVHPVDIGHDSNAMLDEGEVGKKVSVFKRCEDLSQVFKMTFKKSEDFELSALYADVSQLPPSTPICFAKYSIKGVPNTGAKTPVKTRIRYDLFGRLQVEEAWWEEKVEYEEEKKVELTEEELKNEPPAEGETEGEEKKEKKYKIVKETKSRIENHRLQVTESVSEISKEDIARFTKNQQTMSQADYVVASTNEAKNNLESYSYDLMDKVYEGGELYEFLDPKVRDNFANELQEAVDWIYGEGENENKEAYDKRLNALKAVGGPAARRAADHSSRPKAIEGLKASLDSARQFASTTEEQYSHIEVEDRQKIFAKCAEMEKWLEQEMVEQSKLQKFEDPVLTSEAIREKTNALTNFAKNIMSKPKPQPKPEEKKEEPAPAEQQPEKMETEESV